MQHTHNHAIFDGIVQYIRHFWPLNLRIVILAEKKTSSTALLRKCLRSRIGGRLMENNLEIN